MILSLLAALNRRQLLVGGGAFLAIGCRAGRTTDTNGGSAELNRDIAGRQRAAPSRRENLYQCEGCQGARERDPTSLRSNAVIAPKEEPGERLALAGTVFGPDGTTPAADVVIYAYQTNARGLYADGSSETEWSRRHGRLRGWAITDNLGHYGFETIKPAPYPNQDIPAHIHLTVLEPARAPYWIDDVVFAGEFGVDADYEVARENRGGNGIIRLARDPKGKWHGVRDIVLENHPR